VKVAGDIGPFPDRAEAVAHGGKVGASPPESSEGLAGWRLFTCGVRRHTLRTSPRRVLTSPYAEHVLFLLLILFSPFPL
jgi:hypothetical protein